MEHWADEGPGTRNEEQKNQEINQESFFHYTLFDAKIQPNSLQNVQKKWGPGMATKT